MVVIMFLKELFALLLLLITAFPAAHDVKRHLLPKLQKDRSFQHITYAIIFALFLLWSAQAGVKDNLSIHFLGLTTLTLMYGWKIAYLLSGIVSLLLAAFGELHFFQLPEYLLLSGLVPITISCIIFNLTYKYLPRNIFVFIFIAGFFNGAVTGSLHLVINSLYHVVNDTHDWATIVDNYLIFTPLLAFPEGLLNGMTTAMLCVFKPEWLRVFSDKDYIYNHYHKK